jgi:peptidase M28-like protein
VRLRLILAAASAIFALVAPAGAQSKDVKKAAGTITKADVARRVAIIADDSMMGRDTPSPGLEMTARYIAAEFKRFGLRPGGDSGTWFQRLPLVQKQLLAAQSYVEFTQIDGQGTIILPYSTSVRHWAGEGTGVPVQGGIVLVGGKFDVAELPPDSVFKDRFFVWIADTATLQKAAFGVVTKMRQSGARGIIVINDRDTAAVAREAAAAANRVEVVRAGRESGGIPLVVGVPEGAIVAQFPDAAQTFAQFRAAPQTVSQVLPDWEVSVVVKDTILGTTSSPNVVGIVEGTDPRLKNEYIVFSAHMDHIGITPGQPDSINNGADDDGSGTTGIVELAEAFSRKGAAPKRSLIFLTVSGEEKGLWGSEHFVNAPPVPLAQIIADFNVDMIGRNWRDTVAVVGREHSDLGQTLDRVTARHPELRMTPVNDPWPEERIFFRSDHYNFAKKGVPILFFTSGLHPDYHAVSDSPEKIDAEKEARLLQLVFYLGQEVGNASARPVWVPASYNAIVKGE